MNLFDLFATINLDASDYEEGLENAGEKTQSFKEKLQNGIGKASKVATAAMGAVTAAGAALAGKMVQGASDLAAYGDNIDKASQKMGISAQAYQEWDAILQHSGSSIDGMSKALIGLQTKVEAGSDAFQKLGLTQEQVAAMSTEDLFAAVITGLQSMEEGSERTALAQDLLGNAVKELGPLLNTSAEDTEAMRKRVHELGGVLSDEAVKSSAAFQDNLQDLKTAFSGIKNGIASNMLPGLSNLMKGFTSLIVGEEGAEEALKEGFNSVMDSITSGIEKAASIGKQLLPVIVTSIVENLPTLASSVVDIVMVLGETLIENAPLILSSVMQIITEIGNSILENLPIITEMIIEAIGQIAVLLANPEIFNVLLTSVLPVLLAQIPVIIDNITKAITTMIPQLIQAGVKLLTSLVSALPQIISTIVKVIPQIVKSVVNALTALVPELIQAGVTLLTALVEALPEIIITIVDALPEIIDSIVDALLNMLPQLIDAGFKLFTALVENLPRIISTIVSKMPQIISSIVKAITSSVPKLIQAGSQLIQGLWQGIANVGEWLRQKISGFFGGVVDSIKKFFGIHSPSKVFANIGEMLDKGLAKGVGDYADLAVNAAEDMAEDVFAATDRDFNFTAKASGAGLENARGVVINVYGAEGQNVDELAEIISQKIAFNYTQETAVFA